MKYIHSNQFTIAIYSYIHIYPLFNTYKVYIFIYIYIYTHSIVHTFVHNKGNQAIEPKTRFCDGICKEFLFKVDIFSRFMSAIYFYIHIYIYINIILVSSYRTYAYTRTKTHCSTLSWGATR